MLDPRIAQYVEEHKPQLLDELIQLVSIPSISTLPEHGPACRDAAEWLVAKLQRAGIPNAELIETRGHPLVYGEWLGAPGKPTILLYGHYDVQPIDPVELWRTPPFTPTIEGDSLRARGAVDDKGPTLGAIQALAGLHAIDGGFPVNIKVLLEGEEECGGEAIDAYVRANPERLKGDVALILDTGMTRLGHPELTYGLRGMIYFELIANGAASDLHSGGYGGIAPNPIQALCWVLGELKARNGTINIPGLYELMRPVSAEERSRFEAQSAREDAIAMAAAGLSSLPGEAGFSAVERATARPTFEIHGIRGGFVGEGAKTVIPATATAKLSLRLVADQTPDAVLELVKRRVAELAVDGVQLEVRPLHGGNGVTFAIDSPALRIAAQVLEEEFGNPTEFTRTGGSIPVAALFHTILGMQGVLMGFGLPDDNVHAPNEKFHIPHYYAAIRSVANFLRRMGA